MPDTRTKTILIIEPDPQIAGQLGAVLTAGGFSPIAVDPADIYSALTSTRPALIVLSLRVAEVDTTPLLIGIRGLRDSELASTPIIVGSETGDPVEMGNALRVGATDYYVKTSFLADTFSEKIRKALHLTSPEQQPIQAVNNTNETELSLQEKPKEGSGMSQKTKLLIIEDDKFLRELAVQKLINADLDVRSAVDGEQGVAVAESFRPDIILLDILLPGIDGYEVLKRVKANPELKQTKIAMLSNFGQREDIQKALTLGADQFFVKANYTLDEIVDEVRKILAK